MPKYLLLLSVLLLNVKLFSQQINGRIFEENSRLPLDGASVYIPELMKGAISDKAGNFEIAGLKKGKYLVQFSMLGYSPKSVEVILPLEKDLSIFLQKSEIQVEEILVTSAGKLSRIEETPYQIKTIKADEIMQSGNVSLMDALAQVPGVEQISYGTGIGKPVIRGLSFSRIMTLYRGIRFENQQWGEDHGLGVTSSGIDKVEIIKGPASLIYGSGALGGVINLIDEKPAVKGKIEGDAALTAHSNSLGIGTDIGVKGTSENGNFWILRSNFQNHADYKDGNNRTIGNSRFNSQGIKADAGMIKNWGSTRFSYTYANQKMGIIEETEMEETLASTRNDRKMQLPFQNISDHIFTVQNNFIIGENRLKVTLGHHINLREEIEDDFNEVDLGIRLSTTTYHADYTFSPHKKGEYTVGFQGFFQQNRNFDNANEILLPDALIFDNGIFGLARYNFGKLHLLSGVRFDYRKVTADATRLDDFILPGNPENRKLNSNFGGATGSIGLAYIPAEKMNIKLNIATGFRAPDLAELYSNGEHPGTNRFEIGNASFKREQNIETDLSYSYQSNTFSFEVSGFYNHVYNYIFFSPTSEQVNDLTVWRFFQNDVQLFGGEAGFSFRPASLGFLEFSSNFASVYGNQSGENTPLPLIPANRFNHAVALTRKQWKKFNNSSLSLLVNNTLAQNRTATDELQTPAYNLFHIQGSTEISLGKYALDFNLAVNNLLNTAYFHHLAITRPFEIFNMGRNFRLTTRFKF